MGDFMKAQQQFMTHVACRMALTCACALHVAIWCICITHQSIHATALTTFACDHFGVVHCSAAMHSHMCFDMRFHMRFYMCLHMRRSLKLYLPARHLL